MNLPKVQLEIHCWGGLGSQLYAWALLEDVLIKFPNRNARLVFHSSGVTERRNELTFLSDKVQITEIRDFTIPGDPKVSSRSHRIIRLLRRFSRRFLLLSGFVAEANTNSGFNRIRPWTFQLRGHYSTRTISQTAISIMLEKIQCIGEMRDIMSGEDDNNHLSLHLRLGDLISLDTKKPISFESIKFQIDIVLRKYPGISKLQVASDTLDSALESLHSNLYGIEVSGISKSALDVIFLFQNGRVFIGTNSKISVWVAIFSIYRRQIQEIYLPQAVAHHLIENVANFKNINNVIFY